MRITGKLMEVSHPSGWRWTSSLSCTDSGARACELVRVESLQVEDRGEPKAEQKRNP